MPNDLDEAVQSGYDAVHKMEEAGIPSDGATMKAAARLFRRAGAHPMTNLAVCVCDTAFAQEAEKATKEGKSPEIAKKAGRVAYCAALPKVSGASSIRDFIACVTHGIAMEILPGNDGTRLLYAAQVAHTALTKRPKKRNKSSHTSACDKSVNHVKS